MPDKFEISLLNKRGIFEKELKNLLFVPLPEFDEVRSVIEKWTKII
ncbi:hypothetical protein [Candidatus Mancarchaeum acidiphilum]|nr:hypothetical protein [Candidatus Mancarchaeum acidiphilum]